jgi:hypothetical protein
MKLSMKRPLSVEQLSRAGLENYDLQRVWADPETKQRFIAATKEIQTLASRRNGGDPMTMDQLFYVGTAFGVAERDMPSLFRVCTHYFGINILDPGDNTFLKHNEEYL